MSATLIKYDEIIKHNTPGDLYMVIHGKVYDVTNFVNEHPGGETALIEQGAKDATEPFEDVGHTEEARELLLKYYIGDLDPESVPLKQGQNIAGVDGNSEKCTIC